MDVEEIIRQIEEAKNLSGNINLDLGKILKEAKQGLTKKEFKALLNDARVNYKLTQANKFTNYYDYSLKCNSKEIVIKLGVEKVDVLAKIKDEELQQKFHELVLKKNVSFRHLSKAVKLVEKNSELSPENALIEVENEKKEVKPKKETVDKDEYDRVVLTLKAEIEQLKKELSQLKQKNTDLGNHDITVPKVSSRTQPKRLI